MGVAIQAWPVYLTCTILSHSSSRAHSCQQSSVILCICQLLPTENSCFTVLGLLLICLKSFLFFSAAILLFFFFCLSVPNVYLNAHACGQSKPSVNVMCAFSCIYCWQHETTHFHLGGRMAPCKLQGFGASISSD